MVKNGYQEAHIHEGGWISGVVYLKTISENSNDQGALEVSIHGYDLPVIENKYPKKIFRPNKGDIILFPSSLFHKTIPFTEDKERCVIAFDLRPLN